MTATAVPSSEEARAALATEWRIANPGTPDEIYDFYRTAGGLRDDLEAWHLTDERRSWTEMLVHVAKAVEAKTVLDIGCGAGHDLAALKEAGIPCLKGVEPNNELRHSLNSLGFNVVNDVGLINHIEEVDVFNCVDVLEHIPDPEAFLDRMLGKAQLGSLFFEATATHDTGTPLHLKANRGWQPGRWLEQHGWWILDQSGRVHVWQKQTETGRQTASMLLVVHKMPSVFGPAIQLTGGGSPLWRMSMHLGDAMIARGRSMLVSEWYVTKADDVFLMVDDDIQFSVQDADRAIEYCRNGYDIVGGAYPVRNGAHLAVRTLPGEDKVLFAPNLPPKEILWAATGFMAVHRRVIDRLVETLPLVASGEPWFWPFFQNFWVEDERTDGLLYLSEDWGFCELARQQGFKVWVDTQTILTHEGRTVPLTIRNMGLINDACKTA